ncbi:MAG: RNA-binding protein [Candidatus Brockarchaeota archaeon]|nr:RNA-binding protein [Candidatus Brockarchaeota archaeon]MBO3768212.1 RNA-binding protein [Candidatus Brockarchaeota archaeon]MBO3801428.1 RNA-binding protein [Candidatus Brockarchaeota archaeon]
MSGKPIVVPGEILTSGYYRVGENTIKLDNSIIATKVGIPQTKGNTIRVIALKSFYIPKIHDLIIGVVSEVYYNMWRVNIFSPYVAVLPAVDVFGRRFDPTKDNTLKKMDAGTVLKARITFFDRTQDPVITIRGEGLGVIEKGFITYVNPSKIAKLIGKKGNMLQKIEQLTNTKITVGQNGVILIETQSISAKDKVIKTIKLIEREAHLSNLGDRVTKILKEDEENELEKTTN